MMHIILSIGYYKTQLNRTVKSARIKLAIAIIHNEWSWIELLIDV